ncbi:hypothetical protein KIMH_03030 [Bombiscardovia apis]|uniref:Ribbon-helix-helix protein CopG domain-containing protein n=1 Tax=Bombiscardovia apis TaxID=2932182 RepID=A0ABM8BBJ9_9BIFI|nr:ribbon-helix-helix protein, CopG family [Bombiscardovia apis]BDR54192.1 hypothetical protein KIMH_03030 [Bombiscardovia apis]
MSTYTMLSESSFIPEEAALIRKETARAERGYSSAELETAVERTPGRPLAVGATPASTIIKVRLDDERDQRLNRYARQHGLSVSAAVRALLDQALAKA